MEQKTPLIIDIADSEDAEKALEMAFHQFAKHFINDHKIVKIEDFIQIIIRRCLKELMHNTHSDDFKVVFCVGLIEYIQMICLHLDRDDVKNILKKRVKSPTLN